MLSSTLQLTLEVWADQLACMLHQAKIVPFDPPTFRLNFFRKPFCSRRLLPAISSDLPWQVHDGNKFMTLGMFSLYRLSPEQFLLCSMQCHNVQ
jgi:hypothetical protein